MKRLILLGAGDHAQDVLQIARECRECGRFDYEPAGFLVEAGYGAPGTVIDGLPILGDPSWLEGRAGEVIGFCAVGSSALRLRFSRICQGYGIRCATIVHPSVLVGPDVELGEGVVLAARCVVTRHVRIGDHSHVNVACTLPHGTVLADHVTMAPGVQLAGNVQIDTGCFVGIGASIVQRRRLGRWSTIGAGCAVIADVADNATVVGVPGRTIKVKDEGWYESGVSEW
jgi:sugar O-acyltransferase (sialic acid O-acetyltransferase NeuD family)